MVSWKNSKGLLGAVVLWGVIWFVHPAQDRVNELEEQISAQYTYANFLLRDTVKELLKWDFSEPITDENEEDFPRYISKDFRDYTKHSEFYDAMHSENHEMVDRVKKHLAWKY